MVCILAGVLAIALVAHTERIVRSNGQLVRQQSADRAAFLAMFEKLQSLVSIEYVSEHLQKYGVGPYMLTAADRIARDIAEVRQALGLDEADAIEYLKQGVYGHKEQRGSEPEGPQVE